MIYDGPALECHHGIDRTAGWYAGSLEQIKHPPDTDPMSIFAPGPVWIVIDTARKCSPNNTGASGIYDLIGILCFVPIFQIGSDNHRHTLAIWPFERLTIRKGYKVIMHSFISHLFEKCWPERTACQSLYSNQSSDSSCQRASNS